MTQPPTARTCGAFIEHHGQRVDDPYAWLRAENWQEVMRDPSALDPEIRAYLEGNICRCTGYHNIVKAIMAASGQDVSAIAAE